ncbi:MAG: YggT family protein [Candidatus Gracilibacteria bacterium]|nr:YggT family protein [Candidatus Gracilibacteria bacterium]
MSKIQFINFTANFVVIFRDVVTYALIARIIMSWFSMGRPVQGRISLFLKDATDPILNIAKKLPHKIGMIDLSPLIALIGIDLLSRLVIILLAKI